MYRTKTIRSAAATITLRSGIGCARPNHGLGHTGATARALPSSRRRGLAPIEMVMCMPFLVLVFALIIWVGAWGIAKSQVAVLARNNAWRERFKETKSRRFNFDSVKSLVQKESSRKITVIPLFDAWAPARSRHVVCGNAWDYRRLDLNRVMNIKLQFELSRRAAGQASGSAAFAVRDLSKTIHGLTKGALISSIKNRALAEFGRQLTPILQARDMIQQTATDLQQKAAERVAAEKKKLDKKIAGFRSAIKQLDDQIKHYEQQVETNKDKIDLIKDQLRDKTLSDSEKKELETKKDEVEKANKRLEKDVLPPLRRKRKEKADLKSANEDLRDTRIP